MGQNESGPIDVDPSFYWERSLNAFRTSDCYNQHAEGQSWNHRNGNCYYCFCCCSWRGNVFVQKFSTVTLLMGSKTRGGNVLCRKLRQIVGERVWCTPFIRLSSKFQQMFIMQHVNNARHCTVQEQFPLFSTDVIFLLCNRFWSVSLDISGWHPMQNHNCHKVFFSNNTFNLFFEDQCRNSLKSFLPPSGWYYFLRLVT